MHRSTSRFWRCFDSLPQPIQQAARASFELIKQDPSHPSLHFKRVGTLWSARVTRSHRAVAMQDGEDFIWVWIGSHDQYERLVEQAR